MGKDSARGDRVRSVAPEAARGSRLCRVIREMTPVVRRTLYRFGMHDCDVDDALQGVFTVFASKIDEIADGAEAAFLSQTARRTAADYRRTLRRRREEVVDFATLDYPHRAHQAPDVSLLAHEQLTRILAQIPKPRREVFALFIEGFTLQEIATSLCLPYGTVASRLHRARSTFVLPKNLKQVWDRNRK